MQMVRFGVLVLAVSVVVGTLAGEALASGTVTVQVQGKGGVSGDGISCTETGDPDCSEFVADIQECDPDLKPPCWTVTGETTLTAAARAGTGFGFLQWAGCTSVVGAQCTVTVTSDKTVTATFVDITDPTAALVSPSAGPRAGSFALSATAADNAGVARVDFRVRGALVGTDTTAPYSVSFNSTAVADGVATVQAVAVDTAGRTSAPSGVTITIDNTAPTLALAGPDGQVFKGGTTQTWTYSAVDATTGPPTVQCRVVPAAFAACSPGSGTHSVSGFPEGAYTFEIRATDGASNVRTSSHTFSIDATSPNTKLTAFPPLKTRSHRATFRFKSTEAGSRFQCKLDAQAWKSCSSPKTYTGLRTGRHTFKVRAIDRAGNKDATPASRTWRIS